MAIKLKTQMVTVAVLALLILCLVPLPAAAIGMGAGPSEIKIDDAVRGGEYEKTIFVFNGNAEESTFELGTSKEIEGWVSFYNMDNREQAINEVNIPSNTTLSLLAVFTIPTDAAEPFYQAKLLVRGVLPTQEKEGLGNTVMMQMTINVTINIGGTATIEGTVSSITAKDTEVGLPLYIAVDFTNGSNIDVSPTITAKIVKGDNQIAEIKHNSTQVKVSENKVITLSWDTSGQREGTYAVGVEVTLARKTIATQELVINLQPPGSLPVEGDFTGLEFEGKAVAGVTTKIIGSFKNTGGRPVRARLIAEIYSGETLVDTVQSEELLIAEGAEGQLVAYFKPGQAGSYRIAGRVVYEGKETAVKELSLTVTAGTEAQGLPAGAGSQPQNLPAAGINNLPMFVAGGVVLVGLAVYLTTKFNRRRKFSR